MDIGCAYFCRMKVDMFSRLPKNIAIFIGKFSAIFLRSSIPQRVKTHSDECEGFKLVVGISR